MCICRRRKKDSKDEVSSSKKIVVKPSKQNGAKEGKNAQKPIDPQVVQPIAVEPKDKQKKKKVDDDDTLSNIPDEMPEVELNRDRAEAFFSDEQLL
ncbi:unnamed protein product [Caenorhabditis auriculariae]|uniref:Uncharacterized protein n=1 Tax=Caenorhabditis auriculariae TaxID=2777116 RepID=A0A8S1HPU7_9PELO|nr:unnamed protein product [Caenorhabditis auriculariae]